jgi:hypothetical protein
VDSLTLDVAEAQRLVAGPPGLEVCFLELTWLKWQAPLLVEVALAVVELVEVLDPYLVGMLDFACDTMGK